MARRLRNRHRQGENQDQRMHMDYGNHTFLHPPPFHAPDHVAAIVYFDDTRITGGSTAVVPRLGPLDKLYIPPYVNMPGYGGLDFRNDRTQAEKHMPPHLKGFRQQLYDREVQCTASPGDVLFYRLDVWHRGTPIKQGHIRRVMNLLYASGTAPRHWQNWNPGCTQKMYYGTLEKVFTSLTPFQRTALGVPPPTSAFWDSFQLEALVRRYPLIDTTPYMPSKL